MRTHTKSFAKIQRLDILAQEFMTPHLSRFSETTMCYPDTQHRPLSYFTILSKIANNGGTMRRKDIIGQDLMPMFIRYGAIDEYGIPKRIYSLTRKMDRKRGRGASTFLRLLKHKFVTRDKHGYHITEDGRFYLNRMIKKLNAA